MTFYIRQIWRGIVRHKYKTILTGMIGVLSVLLLHIYAGNMDSTERQLKRLPEVMRVQAKVSNLNGSLEEGMTIREDRVQAIRASEHAADVIFPLDCMRELYHRQGIEFLADSGSFVVKDPFRMNECKEEMEGIGMLPVASRADFSYDGNALTIMDESFIRSAEALEENLALLRGMLPFVAAIIVLIGYICSYLSIQSRQEEYALLRSLGAGRGRSFCLFFFAFLAGTAAALLSLHKLSVMEMLSKND